MSWRRDTDVLQYEVTGRDKNNGRLGKAFKQRAAAVRYFETHAQWGSLWVRYPGKPRKLMYVRKNGI